MKKRLLCFILAVTMASSVLVFSACGEKENSEFSFAKLENGGYQVTAYNGKEEYVTVPAQYDGQDVVSIGDGAFKDNKTIKQVSFSGKIFSIGDEAFSGCSSLENVFISAYMAYIGGGAFAGCDSLEIECEAADSSQSMFWDSDWNVDNVPTVWNSSQGVADVVLNFGTGFIKDIGKKVLDGCKDKASSYCVNTIMNFLGIKEEDPYAKDFEEIKNQISDLSQQVSDLNNTLSSIEQNLLAATDRSELGTRMTTINQYISKINSIYSDYELLSKSKDEKERAAFTKMVVEAVEKADIPYMLEYINSELTGTSGGTQRPILTLYNQYLEKVYPFKHESGAVTRYFYEYMSGIQAKATVLYTAYCNYKQDANSDESSAYQQKSKDFLDKAEGYLKAQEDIIPKESDYKVLMDTKIDGNASFHEYRLISNLNGKTLYFSNVLVDSYYTVKKHENYDDYWGYEEDEEQKTYYDTMSFIADSGSLTCNDYVEFFKTKTAYNESGKNTDFLLRHSGASFQNPNKQNGDIFCLAKKDSAHNSSDYLPIVKCNDPGSYINSQNGSTYESWLICWSSESTRPKDTLERIYSFYSD